MSEGKDTLIDLTPYTTLIDLTPYTQAGYLERWV